MEAEFQQLEAEAIVDHIMQVAGAYRTALLNSRIGGGGDSDDDDSPNPGPPVKEPHRKDPMVSKRKVRSSCTILVS